MECTFCVGGDKMRLRDLNDGQYFWGLLENELSMIYKSYDETYFILGRVESINPELIEFVEPVEYPEIKGVKYV